MMPAVPPGTIVPMLVTHDPNFPPMMPPPGAPPMVLPPPSDPNAPPVVLAGHQTVPMLVTGDPNAPLVLPTFDPSTGMLMQPCMSMIVPPMTSDPVAQFLETNKVDTRAAASLRSLPMDVQQKVIAEGPVTGTNPSAVLTARIRKIEMQATQAKNAQATHEPPPGQPPPPPGMPPPLVPATPPQPASLHSPALLAGLATMPGQVPPPPPYSAVPMFTKFEPGGTAQLEEFLTACGLVHSTETHVRSSPPEMQQRIMSEGPVRGNKAAVVLSARISTAETAAAESIPLVAPTPPPPGVVTVHGMLPPPPPPSLLPISSTPGAIAPHGSVSKMP